MFGRQGAAGACPTWLASSSSNLFHSSGLTAEPSAVAEEASEAFAVPAFTFEPVSHPTQVGPLSRCCLDTAPALRRLSTSTFAWARRLGGGGWPVQAPLFARR